MFIFNYKTIGDLTIETKFVTIHLNINEICK